MMEKKQPTERERLQAIMEYYVEQYLHPRRELIKKEVQKNNLYADPDFINIQIDSELDRIKNDLMTSFNDVCMFLMDFAFSGREEELRRFEVLFLDLIDRTLLKQTSSGLDQLAKEIANALEKRGKDIV